MTALIFYKSMVSTFHHHTSHVASRVAWVGFASSTALSSEHIESASYKGSHSGIKFTAEAILIIIEFRSAPGRQFYSKSNSTFLASLSVRLNSSPEA